MTNPIEYIDKKKLLEWLRERSDNSNSDIYAASYLSIIVELKSGTFDDHTAQEEMAKLKQDYADERAAHNAHATELIQAERERDQLAEFAKDIIRAGCWDIDGGDLQEKAEKNGFLRGESYDPEIHGDDFDGEPGDTIYVFNGLLEGSKPNDTPTT